MKTPATVLACLADLVSDPARPIHKVTGIPLETLLKGAAGNGVSA